MFKVMVPEKDACEHGKKACLVCGEYVGGGNSATIPKRISKETKRFPDMAKVSLAADLL